MPRRLVAALAVVVLLTISPMSLLPAVAQEPDAQAAAVAPAAEPTVVDELTAGFSTRGPGWHDGIGGYEGHHYWTAAVHGRTAAAGTWRATLPLSGSYRVEAMMPARHATTRAARYLIGTAVGWVSRTVDQSAARGAWRSLGTYELATEVAVRLSARTGDPAGSGRTVAVDALRFVPRESPPPPVIRDIDVSPADTRAVVRFSLDEKGPARTEYRLAGAVDWRLGAEETGSGYADHRQVIDGLRPETDYELRVIASNAGGRTVSDIVAFRTDQRTVDCNAGEDLQAAIDKARPGDTLRIRGGCGGSDTITFGKDLTLKGVTADAGMGALEIGPSVSVGIIDLKIAPPGPLGQQPLGIRNQGRLALGGAVVDAYRGIQNEPAATLLLRETRLSGNLLVHNQGEVTAHDCDMVGGSSFFALENVAGATMTLRDSSIGGWNVLSNEGTASLQNVTMDGADRHASGPISNRAGAVLAIEGSRFTDGFSSGGTGATALWNAGTATITDSAFLRNQGGQAAIVNTGSITLTNVTFRDNVPADCVGCQ